MKQSVDIAVRRAARSLVLQALYELDCTNHPAADVLNRRLSDYPLPEDVVPFVCRLINGVLEHRAQLDALIQQHAPEWPLDQMAIVDRNILRMAIFEFVIQRETPLRVAINEAVELAKLFGGDSAPRFVNGVLGALATREAELASAYQDVKDNTPV